MDHTTATDYGTVEPEFAGQEPAPLVYDYTPFWAFIAVASFLCICALVLPWVNDE